MNSVLGLDVANFAMWMGVSLVLALALFAVAVGLGFATASINESKHRSRRAGFWWGFAVPIVGIALAAALPAAAKAADAPSGQTPSRRLLTRLAIGVGVASVIAPAAAVFVYTTFINDPEPAFDENDLADLVSGGDDSVAGGAVLLTGALRSSTEPPATSEPADGECGASEATGAESTEPAATDAEDGSSDDGGLDGAWVVNAAESEFGYRIPEVLAGVDTEAVGRGAEIEGTFTVAGSEITDACFVVQVASITSDESLRDGQFTGRIMETDTYPTATFVLTEPIALESLPEAGGDAIATTATGDLTLHGVTNPVTFEVQAQAGEVDGAIVVGVLGSIPITFADYDISDPSGGPAQVGEEGTLEFLLQFTQE